MSQHQSPRGPIGPQPPYGQQPYGQQPFGPGSAPGPGGAPVGFAPSPPPPKKKHGLGFWLLIGVLVIVGLVFVSCTAALVGGSRGGSAAPATTSTKAQATQQAADDPTEDVTEEADDPTDDPTEEPTQEPTEEAKPKETKQQKAWKALSDEQQDAVEEAKDYLDSQGFSKKGLIHQLSSDYGSQYKKKDATKAVEYLENYEGVNWKKQAARVAKSYRESQHFSTRGLIHQLESDYGEQFTHDQAVYGAKHSR